MSVGVSAGVSEDVSVLECFIMTHTLALIVPSLLTVQSRPPPVSLVRWALSPPTN